MEHNINTKTALSLAVLYLCLTSTALADSVNQQTVPWSNIVLGYDKPVKQGLLGDMWGIRSDLADHGFTFRLAYLTESAYNLSGGYNDSHHYAFVDDTALTFSQDLERYTGIPDAKIDGNIVNRNHDDDLTSERLINPSVSRNDQAQEAANGGQSITRLGWLTFSRSFMDRKLNWRIGMMNKNQDFDLIVPCDFQLISLCGGKSAKSGLWSNWNVHTWGTAFQYKLTPEVTLKTGVLEYNPSATERSHAWSWSTQGSKGFLLPMEVLWRTRDVVGLPGAYNLGAIFTNGERADLYHPDGYLYHDHTWYIYTSFNQQITQHGDDANRGLSVSNSFGWADERTMAFKYVNSTALRYRGLFDSRPDDMMALGVTYIQASSHYQREQNYLNGMNGVSDINDPLWKPVPGHSIDLDLYYRVQVTSWLAIQPEIQFWKNPAGLSETPDAWVGALKTMVTF
ncbi:carbohydrate porin [Sodalis sp. dw_96]|uniref:carbohydrate porin n=1 Tax=Sodalis sp. dw_96 TaxID=2719794 RepID=UPI001BD64F26|nr:carbohydrate porin [Sodalis sp. dw_96]